MSEIDWHDLCDRCDKDIARIAELEAKLCTAKAALEKYAEHTDDCPLHAGFEPEEYNKLAFQGKLKCECGLAQAIADLG